MTTWNYNRRPPRLNAGYQRYSRLFYWIRQRTGRGWIELPERPLPLGSECEELTALSFYNEIPKHLKAGSMGEIAWQMSRAVTKGSVCE